MAGGFSPAVVASAMLGDEGLPRGQSGIHSAADVAGDVDGDDALSLLAQTAIEFDKVADRGLGCGGQRIGIPQLFIKCGTRQVYPVAEGLFPEVNVKGNDV